MAAQHWRHRMAAAKQQGQELCPRLHHHGSLVLTAHWHTSVCREGAGKAPSCQLRTPLLSACVPWTLDHGEQARGGGQCSLPVNPTPCQLVLSREAADHAGSPRCSVHDMGLHSLVPVATGRCSCPWASGGKARTWPAALHSFPVGHGQVAEALVQPAAELQPCLLGQDSDSSTDRATGVRPGPVPCSTLCPPSKAQDT